MLLNGTGYPGKGGTSAEVKSASKHVMRLASDAALAQHPSTSAIWRSFAGEQPLCIHPIPRRSPRRSGDHSVMRAGFRDAMQKLANQGHTSLIDCSSVIPPSALLQDHAGVH